MVVSRGLLEKNGLSKVIGFFTQSLNVYMDLYNPLLIIQINNGVKNMNRKIPEIFAGRDLCISSTPASLMRQFYQHQIRSALALSSQVMNLAVSQSLQATFQCCNIFTVKICFLKSNWYLPSQRIMSLLPESTEKRLTLSWFALLFKQLQTDIRSSINFHETK